MGLVVNTGVGIDMRCWDVPNVPDGNLKSELTFAASPGLYLLYASAPVRFVHNWRDPLTTIM